MKRLSDKELITNLAIAIKRSPKSIYRKLHTGKTTDRDDAARTLAEIITSKINTDNRGVFQADLTGTVGNEGRPGIIGVDEPEPTEMIVIPRYQLD